VRYLDSGAMYRAATVAVLRAGIEADASDPDIAAAMTKVVDAADIAISTDPERASVSLNGETVDVEIRQAHVTAAVSAVSAVPAVRATLDRRRRHRGRGT
jgi:cytidylate kinase